MLRKLIHKFHKFVCRIKGHKLKVIAKDLVWECERCEATFLRKGLSNAFNRASKLPGGQSNGYAG
jgi:hypothetical protein